MLRCGIVGQLAERFMAFSRAWERSNMPLRNAQQSSLAGENSRGTTSLLPGDIGTSGDGFASSINANLPPPIPPRPAPSTGYYNNYNTNYGMATNPYYYGGTSMNFPSSYGYGGFNRFPYSSPYYGSPENGDFVRLAEEQSRNAFQSIEAIVQAFSSVSMMLDSTLSAIYSSFRAVLGVADQFTRLKMQLSHILTTLAVVRFLRWLWRRMLVFFRLRSTAEELWQQTMLGEATAVAAQMLPGDGTSKVATQWPSLIFFAFVVGGPYLIWKLISKLVASVEDQKRWATGDKSHFLAVALYDFEGGSSGELSIRAGQRLRLAPKELQPSVRGWLLGSVDGTAVGLVPANYIKIIGKQSIGETNPSIQNVPVDSARKNFLATKTQSNSDLEKLFDEAHKSQ